MWPCGVIVNMAEMFNCESKSQVYGHVHSTLEMESMKNVGKYSFLQQYYDALLTVNYRS